MGIDEIDNIIDNAEKSVNPTVEELKKELDKLEAIGDKKRDELDANWDWEFNSFESYQELINEIYKDYYKVAEEYHKVRIPVWDEDLSDLDNECRMTAEDFIDCVESGGFIDYDGHGYYGMEDKRSDISAKPSRIRKGIIREEFTHVYWYNR